MPTEPRPWVHEPLRRTLARNFTIAIVVGAVVAVVGREWFLVLPASLLALWPSLGGHFVELAFLVGLRPRLPSTRLVQVGARLVWWLLGGALLGSAVIATAQLLPIGAPPARSWWIGAPLFMGIELTVHAMLFARRRPNFYRGDG